MIAAKKYVCFYVIIACDLIAFTNQRRIYSPNFNVHSLPSSQSTNDVNSNNDFTTDGTLKDATKRTEQTVPYIRESIPMRIFECVRQFSILRCTKLFVLQKMEERKIFPNSGNLTRDFLEQFFGEQEQIGSLISGKYAHISDEELTQRLIANFQKFFKNRNIKLHFLPGIMVKVIPSRENKLKLSLRKKLIKRDQVTGRKKKKPVKKEQSYKETIIQFAVPAMVMPAILMGTFLPFILPVLKMATIMSTIVNNSAFIAALIYAAKTHANAQVEQPINYGHPGGHH